MATTVACGKRATVRQAADSRSSGVHEGVGRGSRVELVSVSPTAAEDAGVTEGELAEQPVKAKFLQVVLRDFDELRLDLDLRWCGAGGAFDHGIDQVQVLLCVTHDEAAAAGEEVGASPRGKLHALGFEEVFGRAAPGRGVESGVRAAPGRSAADEARRDAVFLGDEGFGRLGERDDEDRVGLDLEFQVGQICDVSEGFAQREVGQVDGDGLRRSRRVELEDDVHAAVSRVDGIGVEGGGALAQVFDGFAHSGVGEINARDNDFVQLAVDRLGAARGQHGLLEDGGRSEVNPAHGRFPRFVDLRDHGGTGVVVSGIGHAGAGHVDLLHAAARGDVVAVEAQDGFVFGEGFIEPAGVIKPLAFIEEGLHFLDLGDESGGDGLVEIVGRLQAREQALGRLVIGIVLRLEEDFDRVLCILPAAFLDAGFGQAHDRLGEAVHRGGAKLADVRSVRQRVHGSFVLSVGCFVVALHERRRAALHSLWGVVFGQLHSLGNFELGLGFHPRERSLPAGSGLGRTD